nr:MAG TPA: hypothetical protein [Caudoviricetes sp.]
MIYFSYGGESELISTTLYYYLESRCKHARGK